MLAVRHLHAIPHSLRTPDRATPTVANLEALQALGRVVAFEYEPASRSITWRSSLTGVLGLPESVEDVPVEDYIAGPVVIALDNSAPWETFDLALTVHEGSGPKVELQVLARRLETPDEAPELCVGLVRDVTERRETEQALRGVIDRYRLLVDLTPDAIVVHQGGVIQYVNTAGINIVGASSLDDMIGRSIVEFLHPNDLGPTLERIAALEKPGDVSEVAEVTLLTLDGGPFVVESTSVLTEWEGEPAYQVILRDISERLRADAAVRHQARLVQQVSDAILSVCLDGRIESWNPAAERLYGWSAAEAVGRSLEELLGPQAVRADGSLVEGSAVHRTRDGEMREVSVSTSTLVDGTGAQSGTVAMCTDWTDLLHAERVWREAEARYASAISVLEEGVIVVDQDGTVSSINQSARTLLGPETTVGMNAAALFELNPHGHEDGSPMEPSDHPAAAALRQGRPSRNVVMSIGSGADLRWLSVSTQPILDPAGGPPLAVVCSFSDVTEQRASREQLEFQATHDPLTGLPNRRYFLRQLQLTLAAREGTEGPAVMFVDLDRFKAVNDSLGHAVADDVLRVLAERLRACTREGDIVSRLAGDEFVVLSRSVDSADSALALATRIAEVVGEPVVFDQGYEVGMTASVGVAVATPQSTDPEALIGQADVAVRHAKQLGRARVEIFDEGLRSAANRRARLQHELRRAIDRREINVHFQPVASAHDGRIVGVEALARWTHETFGPVGPAEFVGVAEEGGLAIPLGALVLQKACMQLAEWKAQGQCPPTTNLAVNVSPRELVDPGLVTRVAGALQASGVDPDCLWLEITESVLIDDPTRIQPTLEGLRNLGVHLSIDDFGTGYSSLSFLRQHRIETLKIDRSFVGGLGEDPEAEAIVTAILRLAQSLNLETVGEGVETEEQMAMLRVMGCDLVQGYFIGRPGSEVDFTDRGAPAGTSARIDPGAASADG